MKWLFAKLRQGGVGFVGWMALVAVACAGTSPPRPATAGRIKDSAPEKIAAQRAANRPLQLEDDDQRWGIEAARERANEKKNATNTRPTAPAGPVHLQKKNPTTPAPTATPAPTPGAPIQP